MNKFPRPIGDKKNSNYFKEYLQKIYEYRHQYGIDQNIEHIHSFHIQVEVGSASNYIAELLLLTPYQYVNSFILNEKIYHILRVTEQNPLIIIHEPRLPDIVQTQSSYHLNNLSPIGRSKPFTRYIGEIFVVNDLQEIEEKFTLQKVDFQPSVKDSNLLWTTPSPYTSNQLGYLQKNTPPFYQHNTYQFPKKILHQFQKAKEIQAKSEIDKYILPIDHFATRVYSHCREHAILEYLSLTNYYFWGAYNIGDQNSSTNICRNISSLPESISPAKVFTANNTPYYATHIDQLPSPTENFVKSHGQRLHHIAIAVKDGFIGAEKYDIKNVDFVVQQLQKYETEFLENVIGSCSEGLKQIFSKPSKYSFLITEYIQRCDDFQGFFTKENVAALTKAAGIDDMFT